MIDANEARKIVEEYEKSLDEKNIKKYQNILDIIDSKVKIASS